MDDDFKLPRLYTPDRTYSEGGALDLNPDQAHYLRNVIRIKEGSQIRVFNGAQGEWLGTLSTLGKKSAALTLSKQRKPQPAEPGRTHLFFTPIKKTRMDILIEKAVELGVTDFHPLLTQNTEVRKINQKRLEAHIVEAAEQCERFAIPALHIAEGGKEDILLPSLTCILHNSTLWENAGAMPPVPLYAAIERHDAPHIKDIAFGPDKAFLIGPEGGFTAEEKEEISSHEKIQPLSLGDTVYRVETAAIICLVKSS